MWLLAAMETQDYLHIVQIVVMVLIGIPGYLAWFMLRTHRSVLKLNAMIARHQQFVTLTDNLSADSQKAAMLHIYDQFDPAVFQERYEGNPKRIESYLLMKRKYLYLIVSSVVEKEFPVREKATADVWIRELAEFFEFRDVHGRHAKYYPEFSAHIEPILRNVEPKAWMCELQNQTSPAPEKIEKNL